MVGVSKRTGGCIACRKRKVKCDAVQPVCGPCSVKQRSCQPYSRDYGFVASRYHACQLSAQSGVPKQTVTGFQLMALFLDKNTNEIRTQSGFEDLLGFTWIGKLPSLTLRGATLDSSLFALGSAGMSHDANDFCLARNARVFYGQALMKLQRDLSKPCASPSIEVIINVLLLCMYQLLTSDPARRDYITHIMGLNHLLYLCGPSAFRFGFAHKVFLAARFHIILAILGIPENTFLCEHPWREVPWYRQPKSIFEQNIDLMTFIPALRKRFVALHGYYNPDKRELIALIKDIRSLEECFRAWSRTLHQGFGPTSTTPTRQELLEDAPSMVTFPVSYNYANLMTVSVCTIYWANLVDLNNMLAHLYEVIGDRDIDKTIAVDPTFHNTESPPGCTRRPPFGIFDPQPETIESAWPLQESPSLISSHRCRSFAIALSRQICMSVQYSMKADHKLVGRMAVHFPIKIALRCFVMNVPQTVRELTWTTQLLENLSKNGVPGVKITTNDKGYYVKT